MTDAYYIRCMGPWPSCGHDDTICTASPSYQEMVDRNRRTPAPEGEVVAWRNLGWFSGLARKHGHHAQADWLDALASPVVPVGVRERVAREICRIVRTWQGFVPTEEYTLEMEVENAWDDWLPEADAILAALGTKGADHD